MRNSPQLSCDDVFDHLTRIGSEQLTLESDADSVESHLLFCSECRDLSQQISSGRQAFLKSAELLEQTEGGVALRVSNGSIEIENPDFWKQQHIEDTRLATKKAQSPKAIREKLVFWQGLAMLVSCVLVGWCLTLPFQNQQPSQDQQIAQSSGPTRSFWSQDLMPIANGVASPEGLRFLEELGVGDLCFERESVADNDDGNLSNRQDQESEVNKKLEPAVLAEHRNPSKPKNEGLDHLIGRHADSDGSVRGFHFRHQAAGRALFQPGCCTDCHLASEKLATKLEFVTTLQKACLVCHLAP